MFESNIYESEDSFPRIAPCPTTIASQAAEQPCSSVPEVSIIFKNRCEPFQCKTNQNLEFGFSRMSKESLYNSNSSSPIPPKSQVPELSILENHDISENKYGTKSVPNKTSCSLPIKTFSMFKKELIAMKTTGSKKTSETNLISQRLIQKTNSAAFLDNKDENITISSLKMDETARKNIVEDNTSLNSVSNNLCESKCCNSDMILKKLDKFDDAIANIFTEIRIIKNNIESFKSDFVTEIKSCLSEVLFNKLDESQKVGANTASTKDSREGNLVEVNNSEEEKLESSNNILREIRNESGVENKILCEENYDMFDELKFRKKNTPYGFVHKKYVNQIVLDPLPENAPLILPSDRSLVMQKLAEKYLPETYYHKVVKNDQLYKNENSDDLVEKHVNELSFASYDYMRKYNLILESHKNNFEDNVRNVKHSQKGQLKFFDNMTEEPKYI